MAGSSSHERFAQSWSSAMFGYANAAHAAYWDMTRQAMSFWGQAASAAISCSSSSKSSSGADSWFRPERPVRSALLPSPSAQQQAMAWGFPRYDTPASFFGATGAMPSPFAVWFNMFPLRGSPAAWPMAFAMMSAGMSRDVAWPTAEANAAMIDAVDAAQETFEDVFPSFRSDGGHAASVPRFKSQLMSAVWMAPLAATPFAQWPFGTAWSGV